MPAHSARVARRHCCRAALSRRVATGRRNFGFDCDIEIDPEVLRKRQHARRETFGMNTDPNPTADGTTCVDANCRACLIDLVYGREF